jgi:predicted CXXCH cytochrome family protein
MIRLARVLAGFELFGLLVAPPVVLRAQQTAAFPHERHSKLFPTCAGCHAGVTSGDAATALPSAALCSTCHDGTTKPKVDWRPPVARGLGLLKFSHATHFGSAKAVGCESCHATGGDTTWMDVKAAAPALCLSCHTHQATNHLADDNVCSTCHRPLSAATALTEKSIAAFPQPPSHAKSDFVSVHGSAARTAGASCATCHARESCARCHLDANQSPAIRALASDSRVARLEGGKAPGYPTPADHHSAEFELTHGSTARANIARCAVCHAQPSCETCHTGDGARAVIRQLQDARSAGTRGVRLERATPSSPFLSVHATSGPMHLAAVQGGKNPDSASHRVLVHPSGFARQHGGLASSGELQCASCHAQRFCTDCHVGELAGRRYHPNNFVSTHPAKAYGRDTECSSCHNTDVFCRSCHIQVGVAAKSGIRSTVFHNAQPFWLLEHGRAARQDLTNCTTCHQQTYCLQCHSDVGSRINPHGPDFNAAAMAKRNSLICLVCHLKNPLSGK